MIENIKKYLRRAETTKCDKATIVLLDTGSNVIEYQYCKEKQCDKATGKFGYGLYCCKKNEYKHTDLRDGCD